MRGSCLSLVQIRRSDTRDDGSSSGRVRGTVMFRWFSLKHACMLAMLASRGAKVMNHSRWHLSSAPELQRSATTLSASVRVAVMVTSSGA